MIFYILQKDFNPAISVTEVSNEDISSHMPDLKIFLESYTEADRYALKICLIFLISTNLVRRLHIAF